MNYNYVNIDDMLLINNLLNSPNRFEGFIYCQIKSLLIKNIDLWLAQTIQFEKTINLPEEVIDNMDFYTELFRKLAKYFNEYHFPFNIHS
jgi:hypothetical protein